MKKPLLFTALMLLLGLVTCKKPEVNTPNPNPGPGQHITDEQRLAVMDAVLNVFSVLNSADSATALPQLLLFLQSQPAFEASGITDSSHCAWARFTDGRLLIIADNRQPSKFENRGGRISFEPEANAGRMGELPEKAPVLLLNAMGSAFINSPANIKPIFEGKGYQVSIGDASVDGLKKINTEDNAIFFMDTHGGDGNTRDTMAIIGGEVIFKKRYGFWTTDTTSLANEKKFAEDLDKERLVYFIATKDEPTKGQMTEENHYAFTNKFVKEYMHFGKNSMIYLEACGSYTNDMIIAFHDRSKDKESVYLGWTNNCGDQTGYRAAKFLFDRLLGANMPVNNPELSHPKEEPPQRPFDIDAVMNDMAGKGFDKFRYKEANAVIVSQLLHKSKIGTKANEDDDPRFILAPSIEYLEINEFESELTIHGIFGKDPGENNREVTVNDVPVQSIKPWEKDKIVCKIPYEGNGSAGSVVVSVRNHKSNPVPLTEWYIDFSVKQGKALTVATEYTLHLRADVHRRRIKPGERNPKPAGQGTIDKWPYLINSFAKDSKATLTTAGSCAVTCDCISYSYASVDQKKYEINTLLASGLRGFSARYGWENRDKLNVTIQLFSQSHSVNTNQCGQVSKGLMDYEIFTLMASGGTPATPELIFTNPDKFDFTIQANTFKFPAVYVEPPCDCQGSTSPELFGTVKWEASIPKFAPTDKTPARMGVTE